MGQNPIDWINELNDLRWELKSIHPYEVNDDYLNLI